MDKWIDGFVEQILNKIKAGLLEVVSIFAIEQGLPLELNKKECAKMLGVDVKTFDLRFNCHEDFPRISMARDKFPRDAVIEWYHNNWQRTAI
jgi:hypothetical protein